eukprot:TRINITY_DN68_c0_g2_i1.p1 TRINITY_DN68_c0_g2~~TRINITY_DN68_c0_g2_i1.p1  ORF type:complete len:2943 (-),score=766.71 TRINITY_DN68_c0_g2_i1:81-8846(-)
MDRHTWVVQAEGHAGKLWAELKAIRQKNEGIPPQDRAPLNAVVQELVGHFNKGFRTWNWELEAAGYGSAAYVPEHCADLAVDADDAKFLFSLLDLALVNIKIELEHAEPSAELLQGDALLYLYLMNVLSRHRGNAQILIQSNALHVPIQLFTFIVNKLTTVTELAQWWSTLTILCANCLQITANFSVSQYQWHAETHAIAPSLSHSSPSQSLQFSLSPLSTSPLSSSPLPSPALVHPTGVAPSPPTSPAPVPPSEATEADQATASTVSHILLAADITSLYSQLLQFCCDTKVESLPNFNSFRMLVLNTLGAVVHRNPTILSNETAATALLTEVMKNIGWTPFVLQKRDPTQEFWYQLLSLQVVIEAFVVNHAQIARLSVLMEKICDLALWASEAFNVQTAEIEVVAQAPAMPPFVIKRTRKAEIAALFKEFEISLKASGSLAQTLLSVLAHVVASDFRPSPENTRARNFIRTNPEFQLSLSEVIANLACGSPHFLELMDKLKIWELLLSPFFLNLNERSLSQHRQAQSHPNAPFLWNSLRTVITTFIQHAAISLKKDSEIIIRSLTGFLNKEKDFLSLMWSAEVLNCMLTANPACTKPSLLQCKTLPALAELFLHIRSKNAGRGLNEKFTKLQQLILNVVGAFLSDRVSGLEVLQSTSVANFFFECIKEKAYETYILSTVVKLLKQPITSQNLPNWTKLFARLLQTLPDFAHLLRRAKSFEESPEYQIVMKLLDALRQVIATDEDHQLHFQEGLGFVNIMTLLDMDRSGGLMLNLCEEVVQTLMVIFKGNNKNKRTFKSSIGYDQLINLIMQITEHKPQKKIVYLLLNMLVEGNFDFQTSLKIRNADLVPLFYQILPTFDPDTRLEVLDLTTKFLAKYTVNKSIFCNAGVVGILLTQIGQFRNEDAFHDKLINVFELLASYTISVPEQKQLIGLLRSEPGDFRPVMLSPLLKVMANLARAKEGPEFFFDFDGVSSMLVLPSFDKWPFSRGFSFCTWLKVDVFSEVVSPGAQCNDERRIFCFFCEDGQGVELFLHNDVPCFQVTLKNEKPQEILFPNAKIEKKRWIFFALLLKNRRIGQSVLKAVIDGTVRETIPIRFPKFASTKHNLVGASSLSVKGTHQNFFGQMGSIQFFDEGLTSKQVSLIYSMGPSYIGCYQELESDTGGGGSLCSKLFLNFSCKAQKGKWCLDNSPYRYGESAVSAKMHHLISCTSRNIKDTIICADGLKVLFPLFLVLNQPLSPRPTLDESGPSSIDHSTDPALCEMLVALLTDMVKNHETNQEEMHRCNGSAILGYLFKKISPAYFTVQGVTSLKEMALYCIENKELFYQIFEKIFLDFQLWIFTSFEVQKAVVSVIRSFVENNRARLSVQKMFDILRCYYWYDVHEPCCAPGDPVLHPHTKEVLGQRPGKVQTKELRNMLLHIVEITAHKSLEEAQALIYFLVTCKDTAQVKEAMVVSRRLLCRENDFIDYLSALGGYDIFLLLLKNSAEEIRVEAIKQMTIFNVLAKKRGKQPKHVEVAGTLPAILLTMHGHFTEATYAALFGFAVGSADDEIIVTEETEIVVPSIVVSLPSLLTSAPLILKEKFLQDLCLLLMREENRNRLIDVPAWQLRLLTLLNPKFYSDCADTQAMEMDVVKELVVTVMHHVILHAFVTRRHGWVVFEKTVAYMRTISKTEGFDPYEIICRLVFKLMHALKPEVRSTNQGKTMDNMFDSIFKKSSPLMNNILNFFLLVEDLLFFNKEIEDQKAKAEALLMSSGAPATAMGSGYNSETEMQILADILEVLDFCRLLNVASFASIEQVSLKSPDKTLLRRVGGVQRLVIQFALRAIFLASGSDSGKRVVNANITRLHAQLSAEFLSAEPPSSKFFHIFNGILKSVSVSVVHSSSHIAAALFAFFNELFHKCHTDIERQLSPQPGLSDKDLASWYTELSSFNSAVQITNHIQTNNVWPALLRFIDSQSQPFLSEQQNICILVQQYHIKCDEESTRNVEQENFDLSDVFRSGMEHLEAMTAKVIAPQLQHVQNLRQEVREANTQAAHLWRRTLRALKSGRGPWGTAEAVVHWKLDKTENYSRMRLKKKRNYNYDRHTGAAKRDTTPPPQLAAPELQLQLPKVLLQESKNLHAVEEETEDWTNERFDTTNITDVHKVLFETPCQLIMPLKVIDGTLTITRLALHFKETRTEVSVDENAAPPKEKHWDVDTIREVHLRRYLLRSSALEIFFGKQTNVFLNFPGKRNKAMYRKIVEPLKPNLAYCDSRAPAEILRKSGLTAQWQKRELSNFDYLMQINTIAGRSYNDITQYPVFPWVLCDYTTPTIDLTNPAVYRDLSKPVGALNPERLKKNLTRYRDCAGTGVPPFMYGSHYSNEGIVLFYLIRMEPFTTYFLKLQGGQFDWADRMFDSIPNTWKNLLLNDADVKELIPEFFYLSDFLKNENGFDFGLKQNSLPLNNVELPAWAESYEDFIRINREALESEYVSQHLHEWIDLIFGYKQRGEEAEKAYNVFHYLTYEGAVDIDKIEDEVQRKATESQISNFGQIPSQLLTRPHPQRNPPEIISMSICLTPDYLKAWAVHVSEQPIIYIGLVDTNFESPFFNLGATDHVFTVNESRELGNHKWTTSLDRMHNEAGAPPFLFEVDPLGSRKPVAIPFAPDVVSSPKLFSITVDGKCLVTCGHWDTSFKVSLIENGKQIQSIAKHKDVVTCLAMGQGGHTLLTGSKDTTLMVWDIYYHNSTMMVYETPRHVLCGHEDEVTCVDMNFELDVAVSGSKGGTCILHTLRQGNFVWAVKPPVASSIDMIKVSPVNGHIVVYCEEKFMLFLFNISGVLLEKIVLHEKLGDMVITRGGHFLITGGTKRTVVFRTLCNLKYSHKIAVTSPVRSLAITQEERHLLAGLQDGNIVVITRQSFSGKGGKPQKPPKLDQEHDKDGIDE